MGVSETVVEVTTEKRQDGNQSEEQLLVVWIFTMSRMLCNIYNGQATHCFPVATKEGVISSGKAYWFDMDVEMPNYECLYTLVPGIDALFSPKTDKT